MIPMSARVTVDTLHTAPLGLEARSDRQCSQDKELGLFRIVRGLGSPWDATGERQAIAVYSGDCSSAPHFADSLVRGEFRARWEEVYAAPDARAFGAIDQFIFMIEVAVDPKVTTEFDVWYTEKHVPDVRPAGMTRARRFRRIGSAATFLATYEMASPEVLTSDALARVRGFEHFTPHILSIDRAVLYPFTTRET
jgi:hypothetical protein